MVSAGSALAPSRTSNLCESTISPPSPATAMAPTADAAASPLASAWFAALTGLAGGERRPARSAATRAASSLLLSLEIPLSCKRFAHSKSCFCVKTARAARSSLASADLSLIPSAAAALPSSLSSSGIPDPMGQGH